MKKTLLTITAILSISVAQADGGADYTALGCVACHGPAGKSIVDIYPNLAGQKAKYLVKQLEDFKSGVRKDATMNAMAGLVTGKEQAIADYLSKQ